MPATASGDGELTPKLLKQICRENKLYEFAPELNEVLHLHCRGLVRLSNLEPFTGLKAIYLENNALDSLFGLEAAASLRCVYAARNLLRDVEGAAALRQLQTLDVSENCIESLDALAGLAALSTLIAAGNRLASAAHLAPLATLPALTSLDVSKNKIEGGEDVVAALAALPAPLTYLRLHGNPCVAAIPHYRKVVLNAMPALNYLDEAPARAKEHRLAAAFCRGGFDAERAERDAVKAEEAAAAERHRAEFDAMVQAARAAPPPHDPHARLRFKSHEAVMEMKLIEAGMKEWEIEEMRARQAAVGARAAAAAADGARAGEPLQESEGEAADEGDERSAAEQEQAEGENEEACATDDPAADEPAVDDELARAEEAEEAQAAGSDGDAADEQQEGEQGGDDGDGDGDGDGDAVDLIRAMHAELRERAAGGAARVRVRLPAAAVRRRPAGSATAAAASDSRPLLWGTARYRELFQKAVQLGEEAEADGGEEPPPLEGVEGDGEAGDEGGGAPARQRSAADEGGSRAAAPAGAGEDSDDAEEEREDEALSDDDDDADPMERYSTVRIAGQPDLEALD